MRTLGTRRAVLVAGVATVTAAALAACGAGQVAETAIKNPSVYGVNTENADASVLIRGLAVSYKDPAGYPAGSNAPLELNLYNETKAPITVLVSSQPPAETDEKAGIVSARAVNLFGAAPSTPSSAIPEPSGSRPPATPLAEASDTAVQPSSGASAGPSGTSPSAQPSPATASGTGRPARIEIGPLGSVIFRPGDAQSLQVVGLSDRLVPGTSVNLVFEFSNGTAPLVTQAPMAIPLSPASRGPANPEENSGESNPDEEN
jgi:hypothetical protein